jgi:subtilase family serine protease
MATDSTLSDTTGAVPQPKLQLSNNPTTAAAAPDMGAAAPGLVNTTNPDAGGLVVSGAGASQVPQVGNNFLSLTASLDGNTGGTTQQAHATATQHVQSEAPISVGTPGGSTEEVAAPGTDQGAAGDSGGGMAVPLVKAHQVAAPNSIHINAAGGAAPFSPQQIQQAYGFSHLSQNGSGQTIYIVDAFNDPNISSDLQTFDSQWGLPNPNFTVHKMSSRVRGNTSWGVEESLDVEWAHAIAPQANIVLVEATTNSNSNLYAAVDWATNNGAHIVSMSWGGGDGSGDTSLDSHFNHSGVSYVASAGDSGGVVEYPSASPYVLSVGGTSLTLDANNNYVSESAWSSGGGGASVGEAEPTYQTNYGISLSGRGTPDVAYNADPNTGVYVYDSYTRTPGWYEVGGTSAGAPQWAALIALADQGRSTPLSTNNLTSRTEYNAATGSVYGTNYHDVTTGSNGHPAGPGYDLATGVGSPQANNLVPWLINNN